MNFGGELFFFFSRCRLLLPSSEKFMAGCNARTLNSTFFANPVGSKAKLKNSMQSESAKIIQTIALNCGGFGRWEYVSINKAFPSRIWKVYVCICICICICLYVNQNREPKHKMLVEHGFLDECCVCNAYVCACALCTHVFVFQTLIYYSSVFIVDSVPFNALYSISVVLFFFVHFIFKRNQHL